MGIVSIVALFGGFALLIIVAVKIDALRREEPDENLAWGLKLGVAACLFVLLLGVAGIINNYFMKIETPFDPPAAELPEKGREVPEPEPAKIKTPEKRDLVKKAKEEHRKQLDEFGAPAEVE